MGTCLDEDCERVVPDFMFEQTGGYCPYCLQEEEGFPVSWASSLPAIKISLEVNLYARGGLLIRLLESCAVYCDFACCHQDAVELSPERIRSYLGKYKQPILLSEIDELLDSLCALNDDENISCLDQVWKAGTFKLWLQHCKFLIEQASNGQIEP